MMAPLPFLVLLLSIAPTLAEVLQSMAQCDHFLLNDKPPQVPGILIKGVIQGRNTYKIICQNYKNLRRFVTLYDTKNKIPVLSAFKFTGDQGGRPQEEWKIEPQLEDTKSREKNMIPSDDNVMYYNQASDKDYREMSLENRGHLFPASYANTPDDKAATFTLTNAVPQLIKFNDGTWAKMESCVKCVMETFCIDNNGRIESYVITGAEQSNVSRGDNKVNVPSMLWSAFCCYSSNQGKWLASAYWGEKLRDKGNDGYLHTRTLQELYTKLSGSQAFEAFPGSKCPLQETVTALYPRRANCHCEPPAPADAVGPGLE